MFRSPGILSEPLEVFPVSIGSMMGKGEEELSVYFVDFSVTLMYLINI